MTRDDNTQGTGGAGTGSGTGSSSGAGTGTGNGGAGTGSGRTKLAAAVLAVVIGVAILTAPLVDRWADASTRPAVYALALLAVYVVGMHVLARPRRNP